MGAYAPAGAPTISHSLADLAANGCPVLAFSASHWRLDGMKPFDWQGVQGCSVVEVDADHWQLLEGDCVTQLAQAIAANPTPARKIKRAGRKKLGSKLGTKK